MYSYDRYNAPPPLSFFFPSSHHHNFFFLLPKKTKQNNSNCIQTKAQHTLNNSIKALRISRHTTCYCDRRIKISFDSYRPVSLWRLQNASFVNSWVVISKPVVDNARNNLVTLVSACLYVSASCCATPKLRHETYILCFVVHCV